MLRRKTTGVVALSLGAALVIAGIVDHAFAAPRAALCQSGLGQIVQGLDGRVAHDCGLVTTLESAVGWFLVIGILTAVFGAAVLYNARIAQAGARPAEPGDRSWWTRT